MSPAAGSATSASTSASHAEGRGVVVRGLRVAGITAAGVYLLWNLGWLSAGRVPPALFYALTGWPAPTTGALRAMAALAAGDWALSLRMNPLAVPMTALLAGTLGLLAWRWRRDGKPTLPRAVAGVWLAMLLLGWLGHLGVAAWERWG